MKPWMKEWGLVLLVSTLLLAFVSLPNWKGRALEDERNVYVGTFFDVPDYAVHVAMIRAGMQGDWAYTFRFTSEPHQPAYIRLFYMVLGQINRILSLPPETLFHLARWLLGYVALFTLYGLFRQLPLPPPLRWFAFGLAALGSGLGLLQTLLSLLSSTPLPYTSVDLWLIDAYVWFSLALFPHFAFTLALMFAALTSYIKYLEGGSWLHVWVVIGGALLVQCVNPIAFLLVDMTLAALTLLTWWNRARVNWRQAGALAAIAIAQIPLFLYNFLLLMRDPAWSQFTSQNETLSPPPVYYLWGFGLFWLFAVIGSVRALKDRSPVFLSMAVWVVAAFGLAYLPVGIQRRFLLAVTIPFAALTAYALDWFRSRLASNNPLQKRLPLVLLMLLATMSLTPLVLVPGYIIRLEALPENFYPRSLDGAFGWITANTGPDDLFLGNEVTGRLLAQETGRRVYLGHPMETLYYFKKLDMVNDYFKGEAGLPPSVQWVIYGPFEQLISPDFLPGPELDQVYVGDGVNIYRHK